MASKRPAFPKYLRISQDIIEMIRSGELTVGAKAPSENEIIERYKVSNTTARKALQEIEQAGWVTRIKARGTFVRDSRVGRSVDRILGFTRNMIEAGRKPSTKVLDVRVRDAVESLTLNGRRYQLRGPICVIERLRFGDDIPMMKEIRYIALSLCPGIERKDLTQSLYSIYEKDYGLRLLEVNQTLSAVMLERKRDLDLFQLDDVTPAFLVEGATFCGKDVILEMESSLYRGDQYRFSVKAS